ncbi:MAG: VanZ family protein [Clostridia bacterium]|nr:VanZ family protein [Clostridia bacterium]
MEKKRHLAAAWMACVLWMAFIFAMSAAPGDVSGEQSGLITRLLAVFLPGGLRQNPALMARLETFVRKGAHMMEYAVLLCLYRHALRLSGVRHAGLCALALCVGYAATDEIHQAFVPDRGPGVVDVLIDGCGALLGWAVVSAVERVTRSYQRRSGQDGE